MFYCKTCGANLRPGQAMCACGQVFPHPVPDAIPEGEYRAHYWPPQQASTTEDTMRRARVWWESINNRNKALAGGGVALLLIICMVPHPGQGSAEQRPGEPQPYQNPQYVPPTQVPTPEPNAQKPASTPPTSQAADQASPQIAPVVLPPTAPARIGGSEAAIRAAAARILYDCEQNGVASEQGKIDSIDSSNDIGVPARVYNANIGSVTRSFDGSWWTVTGNCVGTDNYAYAHQRNIVMTMNNDGHCTYLLIAAPYTGP